MILGPWRRVLAAAVLGAPPALAQSTTTVIDGDTLNYKGAVVHLWGIDAPDKGHLCADGWDAGKAAADYLTSLIGAKLVTCESKTSPTPGGPFVVCKVDGQDLSAAMVLAGMAWSYPQQSQDYVVQESNAMIAVRGVHAHVCLKPWEWRTRNQRQ